MNLIVAVDKNWGIGKDGQLLASIPGDMKFFKDTTMGKVVVMGRKTLETLPKKQGLKGRINYVITRNKNFKAENAMTINSDEELEKELSKYDDDAIFIIGGASIYEKFVDKCNICYITKMDKDLNADRFMINLDKKENFKQVSVSELHKENGIGYRFVKYEKI